MAEAYDAQAVEEKWQARWSETGAYQIDNDDPRPPFYVLCMYPYPSGPAHMGHVRNYTFGDLIVRYRTMQGYGVLSPMGFDSFGLPAENAAIKTGAHPRPFTDARIDELQGQHQAHRRGLRLAPRGPQPRPEYIRGPSGSSCASSRPAWPTAANAPVNWCPGCQTVLANEQVLADGTCERSGDVVEKRDLEQWFFRSPTTPTQLLDDLDDLDWPERVKTMQRNWIGRSEGAEFELAVADAGRPAWAFDVFTTRPDTSFGMTYVVLAPEHPLVDAITTDEHRADGRRVRRARAAWSPRSSACRPRGRLEKRGVFTGAYAVNPFNGQPVPIYLADYVLMSYGTGAIMAVPGRGPARLGLRQRATTCRSSAPSSRPTTGTARRTPATARPSTATGSTGWTRPTPSRAAIDWLEEQGIGERTVNYRLRDWLLSRQRFWGCPIPIVYCPDHGSVPVPEDQLPVLAARRRRVPPDRRVAAAVSTRASCTRPVPSCGGPAARETDTMDTFVDSSWYFLRFCDPWNERRRRSIRARPSAGCRSTSTSAASSTPSCT